MPAHQRRSLVPRRMPEHGSLQGLEAAHVHLLLRAAVALAAGEQTGPCWGVPAAAGDRAASSARLQEDQAAWAGPEAVQACCPGGQVGLAGLAAFVGVLEVQACQATAVMRNYHISRHSAPMLLSRWRTVPEDTPSCSYATLALKPSSIDLVCGISTESERQQASKECPFKCL